MPFEAYFIPTGAEHPVKLVPLMPGQTLSTPSYTTKDAYAVGVNCSPDDTTATVYIHHVGSNDQDYKVNSSEILDPANEVAEVSENESIEVVMLNKNRQGVKMLIRKAGKAALKPKLN